MAPSSGHLLVPKAMRIIKFAAFQTKAFIKSQIRSTTAPNAIVEPIRIHTNIHLVHPLAFLRQSRSQHRWFSTNVRNICLNPNLRTAGRCVRSPLPVSKTSKAITCRGAAPFASTLRPNLTGGALPRSVGGYSLGGTGVRHFSHTPGLQAQVVQNVSAGIRAFFVNGGKARFDGFDSKTGEKRFKAVSRTEDEILQKIETPFKASAKGTNLDFQISPTITALSATFSSSATNETNPKPLNAPSLLCALSTDFARALTDLSIILIDLKNLAALGELPLSLITTPTGPVLTLRFPGCDADVVSRLCEEAGIRRGVIREDEAWDQDRDVEMALLFPFAPMGNHGGSDETTYFKRELAIPEQVDWRQMMFSREDIDPISDRASSDNALELLAVESIRDHLKPPLGSESFHDSDFADDLPYIPGEDLALARSGGSNEGYEGLEGIYRFLRECEDARR